MQTEEPVLGSGGIFPTLLRDASNVTEVLRLTEGATTTTVLLEWEPHGIVVMDALVDARLIQMNGETLVKTARKS